MECWNFIDDPDYLYKLWASTLTPLCMLVAAIIFQLSMMKVGWAERLDQGMAIKIMLMVFFFAL